MPTAYTSLLGLALPVTGELSGTWGDTVNNAITSLLDSAVAGTTTLSADADVTLTTTTGAANQARSAVILWTASGTVTRNITAPAQSKAYVVVNASGSTQSIVIRGVGPTTGVTVPVGRKVLVVWNGSDFVAVSGSQINLATDVTGTLAIANGGTNSTATATAGGVGYGTGTAHAYTTAGTSGQALVSAGASAPAFGTLGVAGGGTGAATLTANNVLLGNGTSALQAVAPGTNGNVLTSNGTTWQSLAVTTPPGGGGTTLTGNVTLTASSPATMSVTPSTAGQYATLPNATTCAKADNLFSIYNAGDYDYGVKNSAGTQIGWVYPKTGALIGLADNSTAAGVWATYGLQKTGITANYNSPTVTNSASTTVRVALDANRTCILFGGTSVYAIIYDASTLTWGSPTLVRSGIFSGAFLGVLSATNQVLVVSSDTTTALQAVTLTIATNTVTVNTPVSATLAGNFSSFGQLIAVSTSWAVSYTRGANTPALRAITVSGTVPTIGAESSLALGSFTAMRLYASGSIVRTFTSDGSNLYATPYTVSGSTLTLGTATSVGVSTTGTFKSFLNGNGNVVCVYSNSGDTNTQASIFKLTGTTEAVSTVIVGNVFGSITTTLDLIAVTASKTLCVYANTGSLVWYANILTDTAGTASVGTEISNSYSGTFSYIQGVYASGNSVRIGINTTTLSQQYVLDCSGTSPVRSAVQSVAVSTSSPSSTASFITSTLLCVRQPQMLYAGETLYIQSSSTSLLFDLLLTANGIGRQPSAGRSLTYTTVGANNNESWGVAAVVGATTGIVINRIEAAA